MLHGAYRSKSMSILGLSVLLNLGISQPAPAQPGSSAGEIGRPAEISPALTPEVRAIQSVLGGPATERFPLLRETDSTPSSSATGPARQHRQAVEALRDAASQLDTVANRLERLELYRQADALRQQAQQLRLDARGMAGASAPIAPPPTVASPSAPRALPPSAQPPRPDNQQNLPTPTLQPSPAPE